MILVYLDYTNNAKNNNYISFQFPYNWAFINPHSQKVETKSIHKSNAINARYKFLQNEYQNQLTDLYNDIIVFVPIKKINSHPDLIRNMIKQADVLIEDFSYANTDPEFIARQIKFYEYIGDTDIPTIDINNALHDDLTIQNIKGILSGNASSTLSNVININVDNIADNETIIFKNTTDKIKIEYDDEATIEIINQTPSIIQIDDVAEAA